MTEKPFDQTVEYLSPVELEAIISDADFLVEQVIPLLDPESQVARFFSKDES